MCGKRGIRVDGSRTEAGVVRGYKDQTVVERDRYFREYAKGIVVMCTEETTTITGVERRGYSVETINKTKLV
eukprot:949286-Amphidinium_carterae.1